MHLKVALLYLYLLNGLSMIIASEKESNVIMQQLQQHIRSGDWAAWRNDRRQLLKMSGGDLVRLMHCLDERRVALVVSEQLLDNDVCDYVREMNESVKEQDDAVISHADHEKETGTCIDYKNNAKAFIKKERERQEQLWFWQRDYNRECALKIFALLQNKNITALVQEIQSRMVQMPGDVAHEVVLVQLHDDLQKTWDAKMLVHGIKKEHWKKVCRTCQHTSSNIITYEKRTLTDRDCEQELLLIPCTIL